MFNGVKRKFNNFVHNNPNEQNFTIKDNKKYRLLMENVNEDFGNYGDEVNRDIADLQKEVGRIRKAFKNLRKSMRLSKKGD